jgi:hypothetical protein
MHLFGHTFDHDYYFELPREERWRGGRHDMQMPLRLTIATPMLDIGTEWTPSRL